MTTILLQFTGFFLVTLVFGYFMPAGFFYYLYYVRQTPEHEALRIQQRRPIPEQVHREIALSILTVFIFSVMATWSWQYVAAGETSLYWHFRDYPLLYIPVSLVLCMLLHDTYFYWTHRLMHWRPIFKYAHRPHHRSLAPTPWAIFAFSPVEAVIQMVGILLLVWFLPLHPLVLMAFLGHDTLVNTAGHTGYEMVPKWVSRSWFYRGMNTVTHHDLHHTTLNHNFGSFFNLWDRLMGTFQDSTAKGSAGQPSSRREPTATLIPVRVRKGNSS